MAGRIDVLVGRAEIGAPAGLRQRPAGIVQARSGDVPLGEQPGGGMVGAAGLADGRVGSVNPSRTRLALVKSVWGIRNPSRDDDTSLLQV